MNWEYLEKELKHHRSDNPGHKDHLAKCGNIYSAYIKMMDNLHQESLIIEVGKTE
jgi:hypothetical protein